MAQLPVPWQDCTFRQKSHLDSRPLFRIVPRTVEKCSQRVALVAHFALLCTFLPGSGLAVLLFGGFWQLDRNVIYTNVLYTFKWEWGWLSDSQGWMDWGSVLGQSMHKSLGIKANSSISVPREKTLCQRGWQRFSAIASHWTPFSYTSDEPLCHSMRSFGFDYWSDLIISVLTTYTLRILTRPWL